MKWALGLCLAGLAWSQSAQTVDEPPLKPGLYAVFNTSKGKIVAELYEKYAPVSVKNFVGLAEGSKPWYDPATKTMVKRPMYQNMIFHRALQGVMIQSGDPTGTGHHNCGFTIRDEFLPGGTVLCIEGVIVDAVTGGAIFPNHVPDSAVRPLHLWARGAPTHLRAQRERNSQQ